MITIPKYILNPRKQWTLLSSLAKTENILQLKCILCFVLGKFPHGGTTTSLVTGILSNRSGIAHNDLGQVCTVSFFRRRIPSYIQHFEARGFDYELKNFPISGNIDPVGRSETRYFLFGPNDNGNTHNILVLGMMDMSIINFYPKRVSRITPKLRTHSN